MINNDIIQILLCTFVWKKCSITQYNKLYCIVMLTKFAFECGRVYHPLTPEWCVIVYRVQLCCRVVRLIGSGYHFMCFYFSFIIFSSSVLNVRFVFVCVCVCGALRASSPFSRSLYREIGIQTTILAKRYETEQNRQNNRKIECEIHKIKFTQRQNDGMTHSPKAAMYDIRLEYFFFLFRPHKKKRNEKNVV